MNEQVKQALENIKHYDSRVGLHEEDYNLIVDALNDYEEDKKELIAEQHRLFELAKEQENELKELKEFVKTIISHTNINRLTLIGENEITISYFSEKWHTKDFDLIKKVVERYGK